MFAVTASRNGDKLLLQLQPQPGANVSPNPQDVYFFSLDSQTVPTAPQILSRAGSGWLSGRCSA